MKFLTAALAALALAGCGAKPSTPTAAPTTTTTIRLEPSDCGYRLTSWRQTDRIAKNYVLLDANENAEKSDRQAKKAIADYQAGRPVSPPTTSLGIFHDNAEETRRSADDAVIAAHQIGCNWAAGAVVAGDRLIEFNPPPPGA